MSVSPQDLVFLRERCEEQRTSAIRMRYALSRLEKQAAGAARMNLEERKALFQRLAAWTECARKNTDLINLIRKSAQEWAAEGGEHATACRRLARFAQAPLRREQSRAAALLIRIRAEYKLHRMHIPGVEYPSLTLPSGRQLARTALMAHH